MRFLLVDDSPTIRRILINCLNAIGFTATIEAADGQEAVDCPEEFDFVITDWNMPRMTGVEFIRAFRATPRGRSVPVLMVTTRSFEADVREAIAAGVNGYIVKPFSPDDLKRKIHEIISAGPAATPAQA